ncbi:MAG: ROK family protein [Actinobacteria bacterium]|nr:ROK family protein [Actinomycetota bacterium]
MKYCLGLDVGGTKILGGLVDERGRIVEQVQQPSHPDRWPDVALEVVAQLLEDPPGVVRAVGLAVAAWVEFPSGRLAYAPNLVITNRDLVGEIEDRFSLPAGVDNDAGAAAWAEFRFGAGGGMSDMLMVTVGTGVGGGAVLGGFPYRGSRGFAAEFGHVPVSMDGPRCPCGSYGCLETVASGRALGRMARERVGEDSAILELAGDRAAITGELVGSLALNGDAEALSLVSQLGRNLGVGLTGLAKAFDPQAIVVGGGVSALGDILLEPARAEMVARYEGQVDPPELMIAAMGNEAGVVGSADLALQRAQV